ncbi:MAG: recombinase family protein [Verrucomicrobia bacterium]|nr:recombinase family protein [Verrucomicrobiota bacterium]
MESILASFAQFDNDIRAERTAAGMKAALEKGRWPYKAPIGYLNATGKDGEPTLIPDPDRADMVRKAFDLYASGLHTKRDVLRMVTNEGLRTAKKNLRVTPQTFDRLLRNPIYSGKLVAFNGSVRTRGSFEPLVTEETFNRAQAVLNGKRLTVTPHQRNNPEFPLRVFVRCGDCERPLTGSKSTGRKGVKYSYYHCPKCGKVREHKVELERQFVEYLEQLQPKAEYVKLLNEIVLDVWKKKQVEAIAQTTALDQQLTDLQERKQKLVDAFVYRQAIDQATYQRELDKLNEEITLAEMAAHEAKLEAFDVEAVLNSSEYVLTNAARLWMEFPLEQKQRLQRVLFPAGVTFFESGFRTTATNLIFNLLQQPQPEKARMATPAGFEPALPP